MYQLAPSGTPIGVADLAHWMFGQLRGGYPLDEFRQAICRRYGVPHCFFVSTGRAAFALILEAMRNAGPEGRDEVVIPSYTCYSVPASVARAGLKVRVCDIDPDTLDYDFATLEKVDFRRVLCIASANLYGITNDLPRIRSIAQCHRAFVLDDAAQSMDATFDGCFSGTMGDAGFFSLDKGKNITTIDGGIIVTHRSDLAARLEAGVARLPRPSLGRQAAYFVKLLVYAAFLHPRLYWIPDRLPFLGLGRTPYPPEIAINGYPPFLAGIGSRLFARLDALTRQRVANASRMEGLLRNMGSAKLVTVNPRARPVFLRMPLFVQGDNRDRAVAELKRAGIGATRSYPSAVVDIPRIDPGLWRGIAGAEGGRWVAEHILTLPTHPFVSEGKLREAAHILEANAA